MEHKINFQWKPDLRAFMKYILTKIQLTENLSVCLWWNCTKVTLEKQNKALRAKLTWSARPPSVR